MKPAAGMEDMKGDMGGAAAVTGLMYALAERKANVNAEARVRDRNDQFTAKYSSLVRKASNNHPGEKRSDAIQPFLESPLFVNLRQSIFPDRQKLDLAGLIGRAMSTSYIPKEGEAYEELLSDLQQLFESSCDENGFVGLVYQTEVYLGEPIY